MNRFELVIALPLLPLFAICLGMENRRNPLTELRRIFRNWKLHWVAQA